MKCKINLEYFGRLGVFIMAIITLSKTSWYQNLPFCLFQKQCWAFDAIMIYIGIILMIIWVFNSLVSSSAKEDSK